MKKNKIVKHEEQNDSNEFKCDCGYHCDDVYCIFEHKYGSDMFFKMALSALNNILIEKGVCTEQEILDGTLGVMQSFEKDEMEKNKE